MKFLLIATFFFTYSICAQSRQISIDLYLSNNQKGFLIKITEQKEKLFIEYKLLDSVSNKLYQDKKYNRILRKINNIASNPEETKTLEKYIYELNLIKEKYSYYKTDSLLIPFSENGIYYNDFNNLFNTHKDVLINKRKPHIVLDSNRNMSFTLKTKDQIQIIAIPSPTEKSHPILISFLKNTFDLYRKQKQNDFLKEEYIYNY